MGCYSPSQTDCMNKRNKECSFKHNAGFLVNICFAAAFWENIRSPAHSNMLCYFHVRFARVVQGIMTLASYLRCCLSRLT